MRTIRKGPEPASLSVWKRANPHGHYNQLTEGIRRTIRQSALEEQFYLCAYCCQRLADIDSCHNEHVEARSLNPRRALDFSNIVASCDTRNQCDKAHKSQILPLTPLMVECETELRFKISGRVEGLSDRATTMIQVLNLGDHEKNNRALIGKRKQLAAALLWKNGINPDEGLEGLEGLEDIELLKILIGDLAQPQNGQLEPYSPVVINIIRSWLQA